jgi:hypothetical protein
MTFISQQMATIGFGKTLRSLDLDGILLVNMIRALRNGKVLDALT